MFANAANTSAIIRAEAYKKPMVLISQGDEVRPRWLGEALSAAWKENETKNQIPCQEICKLQQKLSLCTQKYENSIVGIFTKRTSFWSYGKRKIIPTNHKGIWGSEHIPTVPALTSALDGGGGQPHASAAIPRGKWPGYPLNWRLYHNHSSVQ